MSTALSLVVPAFNESGRLPRTLAALATSLPRLADDVELVVVDDGSVDDTAAAAERFAATAPLAVRVVRLGRNRGKGAAVAAGVAAARHPLVAFTDADSPYDLESLLPMVEALASGRCDVAIGARDLPESQINRGYGALRYLSGQTFSMMTWLAIGLPFRDSQCGLKAFRTDAARRLFAMRTVDGFGFDFELLAAAVANGLRVERFPVRLTHDDDSRIALVRDSLRMTRDLLHVRRNLKRGAYAFPALPADATPCPVCGATEFEPRVAHDGFRLVECRACRVWYLNPMPTRAALAALYGDQYYASDDATDTGYADYAAMADDHRDTFRRRLSRVARHVGQGRILDVGAGYGYLADAAAPTFRERWVVELSRAAARRVSPAHKVVVGDIETVELPRGYFDVVSLQDCFEHLPDPRSALAKIRDVLRPGGALLAVTPDAHSWLARVQGSSWVSLKFPEHVILYSRGTLRRVLESNGFAVESMTPAGQYARFDFLAERVAKGHPRLADALVRAARRFGGHERRVYVPSGSVAVVATPGSVPQSRDELRTADAGC
jgi:dolichyl-phosphate beta-glucosyltransferase